LRAEEDLNVLTLGLLEYAGVGDLDGIDGYLADAAAFQIAKFLRIYIQGHEKK
jgi:hypothetical protein